MGANVCVCVCVCMHMCVCVCVNFMLTCSQGRTCLSGLKSSVLSGNPGKGGIVRLKKFFFSVEMWLEAGKRNSQRKKMTFVEEKKGARQTIYNKINAFLTNPAAFISILPAPEGKP